MPTKLNLSLVMLLAFLSAACGGTRENSGSISAKESGSGFSAQNKVVSLAITDGFGCAVTDRATVKCWGANNYGQAIATPDLGKVAKVFTSDGGYGACAITESNGLRCWGDLANDIPQGLVNVSDVSITARTVCVVAGKQAKCWGNNYDGLNDVPANLGYVKNIYAGSNLACAITESDQARCWGKSAGSVSDKLINVKDLFLSFPRSGGSLVGLALTKDGKILPLQPKSDLNPPSEILAWENVEKLSTNDAGVCAVFKDHSVRCAFIGDQPRPAFVPPADLGTVSDIALGQKQACALEDAGKVRCWGDRDAEFPDDLESSKAFFRSPFSMCALSVTGRVHCWGGDSALGLSPSDIGEFRDSMPVDRLGSKFCVIAEDNVLRCTGGTSEGFFPRGTRAAAFDHASFHGVNCVINEQKMPQCWHSDDKGQLQELAVPTSTGNVKKIFRIEDADGIFFLQADGKILNWQPDVLKKNYRPISADFQKLLAESNFSDAYSGNEGTYFMGILPAVSGNLLFWSMPSEHYGSLESGEIPAAAKDVLDVVTTGHSLGTEAFILRQDGTLACWNGVLLPDPAAKVGPCPNMESKEIKQIAFGNYYEGNEEHYMCSLSFSGQVVCHGHLAMDNFSLVPPKNLSAVTRIDLGRDGTPCAVSGSALQCWGEQPIYLPAKF